MHRLPALTAGLATITLMSGAVAFGGITTAATASVARHPVPAAPSSGGVTVKTSHSSKLGTHLVTASGRSLYAFNKDKGGSTSHCYKACATDWPPLITSGKPKAAGKAKASLLGTTKRKNGARQVTYGGHPVYLFSEDHKAGQTRGEGLREFGAKWYVVSPKGHDIKH